jgi:hypothetical protein
VIGHVLARDFAANLGMQVAHGVDRAEVEILAEDKGPANAAAGRRPIAAADWRPSFMTRALIQA